MKYSGLVCSLIVWRYMYGYHGSLLFESPSATGLFEENKITVFLRRETTDKLDYHMWYLVFRIWYCSFKGLSNVDCLWVAGNPLRCQKKKKKK